MVIKSFSPFHRSVAKSENDKPTLILPLVEDAGAELEAAAELDGAAELDIAAELEGAALEAGALEEAGAGAVVGVPQPTKIAASTATTRKATNNRFVLRDTSPPLDCLVFVSIREISDKDYVARDASFPMPFGTDLLQREYESAISSKWQGHSRFFG